MGRKIEIIISLIILFGLAGLIIGYLYFAKFNGKYIPVNELVFQSQNIIESLGKSIKGVEQVRNNILITGAIGAASGLALGLIMPVRKRRKRRR